MSDTNNPLSDAAKILDSEPVRNLLSPATKEVGELLGTVANLVRFYATENLGRIFRKWAALRKGRPIDSMAFERVMPLLPLASMVTRDELQEKWALLMESAATDDSFLPSFGQTLSQLTIEEAQYLDRLWQAASGPADYISFCGVGREPMSHVTLVRIFNPEINSGISPAEWEIYKNDFTDQQKANYERLRHAHVVIEDLVRLSILVKDPVAEPYSLTPSGEHTSPAKGSITLGFRYSFSPYGVSFLQAVAAKDHATDG